MTTKRAPRPTRRLVPIWKNQKARKRTANKLTKKKRAKRMRKEKVVRSRRVRRRMRMVWSSQKNNQLKEKTKRRWAMRRIKRMTVGPASQS